MYEEDRQTVLSMYGRMFDETANEEALLELLVSPTRQAVVLARSYDAKSRKTQIEAMGEDADSSIDPDNAPAFIFIIDKTAQQAAELGVKEEALVDENQFSIFDELPELPELDEAIENVEAEPVTETSAEPVELPEPAADVEAVEPVFVLAEDDIAEEETERSEIDDTADAVDAFLADFTIENGELVSVKTEAEAKVEAEPEIEPEAETEAEPAELPAEEESEAPVQTKKKTNILLLILYIFVAIPLGLVGLAVLAVPTVLFLALASVCGYVGVSAIGLSFGAFAVIADTLAVFGAGLALLAIALLFVWLFVWFLGGAMVGFIRGLCRLGSKMCCKEVAVK